MPKSKIIRYEFYCLHQYNYAKIYKILMEKNQERQIEMYTIRVDQKTNNVHYLHTANSTDLRHYNQYHCIST